ncbi:SlyX family protein [Endozoicomonas atrinae]|uniref:SlyX family protein n=1 Tax=Endozoicomonas atrinae TaxID=1333660 RepID=UPI000825F611|nr:SlyX family protein [Endozoicomonas atrinae]
MLDELLELQTQLSYQEDTIAQLNEVVTRQQKDIERLTEAFAQLKKQFENMAAEQLESQEELPPPHY